MDVELNVILAREGGVLRLQFVCRQIAWGTPWKPVNQEGITGNKRDIDGCKCQRLLVNNHNKLLLQDTASAGELRPFVAPGFLALSSMGIATGSLCRQEPHIQLIGTFDGHLHYAQPLGVVVLFTFPSPSSTISTGCAGASRATSKCCFSPFKALHSLGPPTTLGPSLLK